MLAQPTHKVCYGAADALPELMQQGEGLAIEGGATGRQGWNATRIALYHTVHSTAAPNAPCVEPCVLDALMHPVHFMPYFIPQLCMRSGLWALSLQACG